MKKILYTLILLIFINEKILAAQAQLTVWNMTRHDIALECESLQPKDVKIVPEKLMIAPNQSPALHVTFQSFGALIHCKIANTPAWFTYTVKNNFKEKVNISKLKLGENFYYDVSYPGAFTYH